MPESVRSDPFSVALISIIARDGVDANHWRAEADGHGAAGVIAVTRPIADAGGDGLCAATQRRNIRRRNANAPVAGGIQGWRCRVLPLSTTLTTSPASPPLLVPEITSAWACSASLMMSSPATVLMVRTGAVVSTARLWLVLPGLPALSLTVALTV